MEITAADGLFANAEEAHEIGKADYERQLEPLRVDLLNAQYDCRKSDFSTVVLIAGNDRPGVADLLHTLHEWLDARYLDSFALFGRDVRTEAERERPAAWRYWHRLPAKGRIGIFLGAWAVQPIVDVVWNGSDPEELDTALAHVRRFERALVDDGTLLLKFWLHVSERALEKRLRKAKKDPEEHWEIEERDWELLENYDETHQLVEQTVRGTHTVATPWTIVAGADRRHRNLTVGLHIAEALKKRLELGPGASQPSTAAYSAAVDGPLALDRVDLSAALDKKDYDEALDRLQFEAHRLFERAHRKSVASVLVFEGWDAAGKGGAIRRLAKAIPIQQLRVIPIAAPTDEELAHHYLWRFWRQIPADGHTVIFDRSWYGRVLVERVEGFASEAEWRRAYGEINDFEQNLVEHGTLVLKFWLHTDADEQLRRFEARSKTPYKKYKLTEEDYRNREKWPLYERAVHDMVVETSTPEAQWHLVAANDKRWARIRVLETVCEKLAALLETRDKKKKKRKKDAEKRA